MGVYLLVFIYNMAAVSFSEMEAEMPVSKLAISYKIMIIQVLKYKLGKFNEYY